MSSKRGCTQCGNCLLTCPVFKATLREEYSPKAKQDLLEFAASGKRELDWEKTVALSGRCVSCERCLQSCPRKLSVPEILSAARGKHPRWRQYFWREWVKKGRYLWPIAARMAPLAPKGLLPEGMRVMHAAAVSMNAPDPVEPWLALAPDAPKIAEGMPMVFFGGCTANRLRPAWVGKVAGILSGLGAKLLSGSEFTCCGGTYYHAGMRESAFEAARANVGWWRSLGKPKIALICASCMHSLRAYEHMEGVLRQEEAEEWKNALTPLSSFMREAKTTVLANAPQAYGYHSPCHWGAQDPDLAWLQNALPGLRKGKALCCGFGGVFKMMEPLLSRDMAALCWDGLYRGVEGENIPVLTGCSGCSMQLAAHAPEGAKIIHWLDVWR